MSSFVVRFYEQSDASGNQKPYDDSYVLTYDHFYEYYVITTYFSNSQAKPISMNTLEEVRRFFHTLYKYVNLDMTVQSGNYIAYCQVDAGMFPSIAVPRRALLEKNTVEVLDEALDVWASITIPGMHMAKAAAEAKVSAQNTLNSLFI
jgi:hypothetical protein